MRIGEREIGLHQRPYLIAEMSGNHNQSLERALAIVDAAASAGADAIKLQTYTADTMTLDVNAPGFLITDTKSLWAGRRLYELYAEAHTPWEWHKPIMDRARERGLQCFSSVFDGSALDFMESLEAPAYKIASFENTDLPLIARVAATGKPLIISTGMATLAEVDDAVRTARESGCRDLALLKCTSNYPANPSSSNLASIPALRDAFGCEVGLSDHTMGLGAAVASVALGSTIVEKHVTLRTADGGVDSAFSAEPEELQRLRAELNAAWHARGTVQFGPSSEEQSALMFRRSLYVCQDVKAGTVLSSKNMRAIRPGFGLSPKYLTQVSGMRVTRDVAKGTPVSWDLVGGRSE